MTLTEPENIKNFNKLEFFKLKSYLESPITFIEQESFIENITKGKIPFILMDHQKQFFKTLLKSRFVLSHWARRMGATQCLLNYALWKCMYTHDSCYFFMNHSNSISKIMYDEFLKRYNNVDEKYKPRIVEKSYKCINFENGSSIIFASDTIKVRGVSLNGVIADNANLSDNDFALLYSMVGPRLNTFFVYHLSGDKRLDKNFSKISSDSMKTVSTPWDIFKINFF